MKTLSSLAEPIPSERDLSEFERVSLLPPRNAWLLMGDDASYPSAAELRAQHHPTDPKLPDWTGPKQIQRGDLVFLYFVAPKKAIHFIGRATEGAVFDPSIGVNAVRNVDNRQWWTTLSPLVEVPPIPFRAIRDLHGGHLNLRGKPTHYLTPSVVEGLSDHVGRLDEQQRLVLQRPTGNPELPSPNRMGIQQLRELASGALKVEAMVEQYVVEPLLRLGFPPKSGYRIEKQHRIAKAGVADYGIFRDDVLVGVVEAKLGVRRGPRGSLAESPDLAQLRRYCEAADVPGLLVDANSIHVADHHSGDPIRTLERSLLTKAELASLADDLEMLLNKDRRKSV